VKNITTMNADIINTYYNDFCFCMSKSLKSGWGMVMRTYPFPDGAVITVSMERGIAHNLKRKVDSDSLGNALRKTKLFAERKIGPIAEKGIDKTIIGILSTTKYVLFKSSDQSCWNENAAQQDVKTIIKKVKEGYGK